VGGRLKWAALVVAVVGGGCVAPSRAHKVELGEKIALRNFAAAVAQMDAARESEYGDNNVILYWLDKAALLHDAGKYQESDEVLDLAERRMEELYTQSISRGAATFLTNDGADFYAGQVHERTLLHVLRALNYAYLGKTDDAVVEARKVSAFLAELHDKIGDDSLKYRDDGFAQYLSAMLFEDQGRFDDARISLEASRAAYAGYEQALGMPAPRFEDAFARVVAPAGAASPVVPAALTGAAPVASSPADGELVFLHYAGLAPRRETETIQIAWGNALAIVKESKEGKEDVRVGNALRAGIMSNAITVALPTFVQDPSFVTGSELEVGGVRVPTVLVEDVTAIAKSALETAMPKIKVKAIARATTKFLLAKLAEEEMKRRLGSGWGALAGLAARAGAAASEVADTRGWATLPSQFRMARVRLPAGTHFVKVHYLANGGAPAGDELIPGVEVAPGKRTYIHVRTAGMFPPTSTAVVASAPGEAPAAASPSATDTAAPQPSEVVPAAADPRGPAVVPAAALDVPLPPPPAGTTLRPRAAAGDTVVQ